jgi:hypothetical protein
MNEPHIIKPLISYPNHLSLVNQVSHKFTAGHAASLAARNVSLVFQWVFYVFCVFNGTCSWLDLTCEVFVHWLRFFYVWSPAAAKPAASPAVDLSERPISKKLIYMYVYIYEISL